jgi:hypothetical protein
MLEPADARRLSAPSCEYIDGMLYGHNTILGAHRVEVWSVCYYLSSSLVPAIHQRDLKSDTSRIQGIISSVLDESYCRFTSTRSASHPIVHRFGRTMRWIFENLFQHNTFFSFIIGHHHKIRSLRYHCSCRRMVA